MRIRGEHDASCMQKQGAVAKMRMQLHVRAQDCNTLCLADLRS